MACEIHGVCYILNFLVFFVEWDSLLNSWRNGLQSALMFM